MFTALPIRLNPGRLLDKGLPANVSITTLDFANNTLLAGSAGSGIYRSDDQDSWLERAPVCRKMLR